MPVVQANGIDVYYEVQGEGDPVVVIPYLAADQACYAFQVADYVKNFTCFTVDLRGAGLSGKPEGTYTTELFADDIAAFMQAAGLDQAHIAGLSLGAAAGMWLAAKYPARVTSLSLHSAWPATDPFLRAVVETWQIMAQALGSVTDMVIKGIFPWCFTPELYAERPDYIDSLADFVRGRPMPPVDAFLRQSQAVLSHDARAVLGSIQAPTLITFGRHDLVTSTVSPGHSPRPSRTVSSSCSKIARTPRSTKTSRSSTSAPRNSCTATPRRLDRTTAAPPSFPPRRDSQAACHRPPGTIRQTSAERTHLTQSGHTLLPFWARRISGFSPIRGVGQAAGASAQAACLAVPPAGPAAGRRVGSMVLAQRKVLLLAADDFEDMDCCTRSTGCAKRTSQ